MEINKDTIAKTTKCSRCFDCLSNPKDIRCKVERQIGDEILFVKCNINSFCPYKMAFGNSYFCNCPTRIEIYKKYRL